MPRNRQRRARSAVNNKQRGSEPQFPERLHYMICETENDGLASIISWAPEGKSFIVHDRDGLEKKLIHRWFRQSKYQSFLRQLSNYGFQNAHSATLTPGMQDLLLGDKEREYAHPLFLRDRPHLSRRIRLIKGAAEVLPLPANPQEPEEAREVSTAPNTTIVLRNDTDNNGQGFADAPAPAAPVPEPSTTDTRESLLALMQTAPSMAARAFTQGTVQVPPSIPTFHGMDANSLVVMQNRLTLPTTRATPFTMPFATQVPEQQQMQQQMHAQVKARPVSVASRIAAQSVSIYRQKMALLNHVRHVKLLQERAAAAAAMHNAMSPRMINGTSTFGIEPVQPGSLSNTSGLPTINNDASQLGLFLHSFGANNNHYSHSF